MNRSQIEAALTRVLQEIQSQGGRPMAQLRATTRPIGDLEGFDSLNAEEATVLLEEELGSALPGDYFVTDDHRRALYMSEVIDRLCRAIGLDEGTPT